MDIVEDRKNVLRERNRLQMQRWREASPKNREAELERVRVYRKNDPDKKNIMARAARDRARKRNRARFMLLIIKAACNREGIEFNLTEEWLRPKLDLGVCELSGIPFDMEGKLTQNCPTIDRIISDKGYTANNCRLILWSINRALKNYGDQYFLNVVEKILRKNKPNIFKED